MFNFFRKKVNYKPEIDDLQIPTVTINSSGTILYSNAEADNLFQIENAEGSNITDAVSADLPSMLEGSKGSVRKAFKLSGENERYVEIATKANSENNSYVLSFFDVTKDYLILNKLIDYRTNMDNLGRNKNLFFAQMANVFKSPIHSVMGYSQAILEGMGGDTDEKQRKYLSTIYKHSEELFKILDKVTELAKVETHLINFSYKSYSLIKLLNSIATEYLPIVAEKGLQLNINTDNLTQKVIYGDETVLKMVLCHLLDNAIISCDFGTINMTLTDKEFLDQGQNALKIRITDQSTPPKQDEMQYVFNPYYQPDKKSRTMLIKSLSICIVGHLVGQMNGHITAETETSGFTITIPTDTNIEPAVKVE